MDDPSTDDPSLSDPAAGGSAAETAVRLAVAVRRLRARLRAESFPQQAGLPMSQLAVLYSVTELGPVTATSLAAAEHVSQQAIAQSVADLKAAGLVATARDPRDARKFLVSATPAGRELVGSVLASRDGWLVRAIEAVVPPAQRADLDEAIGLLTRLAEADVRAGAVA